MEVRKDYKYIGAEYVAKQELKSRYQEDGYRVVENFELDGSTFDLYVEKNDIKIIFEFKARKLLDRNVTDRLRQIAESHGIHFRIVIVRMPVDKEIEVEGLEQSIENAMRNDMPSELDELSSHTQIEEVEDVTITRILVKSMNHIEVEGKSSVMVELDYGEDTSFNDTYPFTFNGVWSFDKKGYLQLEEMTELKVDTSSYYV